MRATSIIQVVKCLFALAVAGWLAGDDDDHAAKEAANVKAIAADDDAVVVILICFFFCSFDYIVRILCELEL